MVKFLSWIERIVLSVVVIFVLAVPDAMAWETTVWGCGICESQGTVRNFNSKSELDEHKREVHGVGKISPSQRPSRQPYEGIIEGLLEQDKRDRQEKEERRKGAAEAREAAETERATREALEKERLALEEASWEKQDPVGGVTVSRKSLYDSDKWKHGYEIWAYNSNPYTVNFTIWTDGNTYKNVRFSVSNMKIAPYQTVKVGWVEARTEDAWAYYYKYNVERSREFGPLK